MHQRRTVHFRGQVQGVGFRYTTCQVAARFDVTGAVCNLGDGSVRLIAEGTESELTRFIAGVVESMDGRIRDQSEEVGEASGEFSEFSVVHH